MRFCLEGERLLCATAMLRWSWGGEGGSAGGSSFGRADAAQVCSNFGFVEGDRAFECSFAKPARQIVSERW